LIGDFVGGFVGDVYASGGVTALGSGANDAFGGLIGRISGTNVRATLRNSFAVGAVSGAAGSTNVGGLVGAIGGTRTVNPDVNFWDVDTTGVAATAGDRGTGLGTDALRSFATFDDAGWAIVSEATPVEFSDSEVDGFLHWVLCDEPNPANGYPRLAWESERAECASQVVSLSVSVTDAGRVLRNVPFTVVVSLVDEAGESVPAVADVVVNLSASGGSEAGELRRVGESTANPSVTLPAGESSVSVSLIYTGLSDPLGGQDVLLVVAGEGFGSVEFGLSVRASALSITASPAVIAPDGVSTTLISVSFVDVEGVGIAGTELTVSTTLGSFVDAEGGELSNPRVLVTDAVGAASVLLRSSVTPGVATVSVTCPGACSRSMSVTFGSTEVSAPADLIAIAGNRKIWLVFDPSGGDVVKYQYRLAESESALVDSAWVDVPAGAEQPYLILEVENGVEVFVQARTVGGDGPTLPSNTASATPQVIGEPDADLGVTGRDGVDDLAPVGGKATLEVPFTFRNTGSARLENVWFQESALIEGGRVVGVSSDRGSLSRYGTRWFWRGVALDPDESVEGVIVVEVEA
jgi:hypothetical protein